MICGPTRSRLQGLEDDRETMVDQSPCLCVDTRMGKVLGQRTVCDTSAVDEAKLALASFYPRLDPSVLSVWTLPYRVPFYEHLLDRSSIMHASLPMCSGTS